MVNGEVLRSQLPPEQLTPLEKNCAAVASAKRKSQVRPDIAALRAAEGAPGNDYESGQFKLTRGIDKSLLAATLAECSGNVSAAARRLGTTRARIYRWVRFWGLEELAGLRRFDARVVRDRTG